MTSFVLLFMKNGRNRIRIISSRVGKYKIFREFLNSFSINYFFLLDTTFKRITDNEQGLAVGREFGKRQPSLSTKIDRITTVEFCTLSTLFPNRWLVAAFLIVHINFSVLVSSLCRSARHYPI